MATFLTRREAQQRAKTEREEKRKEQRYYNDLKWAVRRRALSEREVYDLYKLSEKYSKFGPEQLEYELGELMKLQEYFKRHSTKSEDPYMNALQKHLYDHEQATKREEKRAAKPLIHAHPSLKKVATIK